MKIEESTSDVAGEYFRRYFILGSRIPFLKFPLFFIGVAALTVKSVEKAIQAREEQKTIANMGTEGGVNIWTAEEP